MVPQNFPQKMLDAAIHLLNAFLKVVLYPFTFWAKAIVNLAEQKKPIYDPTVGLNLDLLFDGLAFLSYPLGVIHLFYTFFADKIYTAPFGYILDFFIYGLIAVYIFPVLAWLANIVVKFAIKLAIAIVKMLWTAVKTIVLKVYNFVVNPQWHFAVKHIHKNE